MLQAYRLMWELKELFDPDYVLNPGVILNKVRYLGICMQVRERQTEIECIETTSHIWPLGRADFLLALSLFAAFPALGPRRAHQGTQALSCSFPDCQQVCTGRCEETFHWDS